ncbi:plasma-membrane proton-e [Laetiporus sulphureus 93-53]|uniref:Plasma membrane ATPase n=1 Tax=Laetiporus sulphureus 93-53 TaxID=1314785 RepID=A0A165BNC7_9APHY|nr:plasma-membrane proton-e [Laetiporus sulphureus 93-53]KZT01357.1 plasma-membrane proton-e [Laetiporus sulphureus 93-53]
MPLFHRKKAKPTDKEASPGTIDGSVHQEKTAYDEGNEYDILLRYAKDEAAKLKRGEGKEETEEEGQYVRLWYMPWKKVKAVSSKEKKIPLDWLHTDMLQGLPSGPEVDKRRAVYGWNELQSEKENQILKFISYFRGPILYVMELAVCLSAGLRDWIDFGVIIGILFLNAGVGWYQEKQAGDIVAQLKAGIALKASVIRDGREQEIAARDVVPGDIVVIEEGRTIPADAKILADYNDKSGAKSKPIPERRTRRNSNSSNSGSSTMSNKSGIDKGPSVLSVDQSAITGESLAVDKFLGDIAYYTCGVKRGKCYGIVVASAQQSFVGKTASLVMSSKGKGHFQIVLGGIGLALLIIVLAFIFIVWIGGFFRHVGIATPRENNLLVYALIFLIIGVPVGLPCVTTTTMAVGAAYLAKHKAIVQKLTAIESLAGVDILCSDKTGTLTANKLSLNVPYIAPGVDPNWFMAVAVLASSHNVKSLDPIDKVTIVGLKDYPGAQEILRGGWITHKFMPFDPVSKRITADVEKDGKRYTCAKGAPNAILRLDKFDPDTVQAYRAQAQEFAQRGFRSLGVAVKEDDKPWQLLGMLSMFDPPRPDTAATIREAIDLGIHVKMLTGDAVAIAIETCKQLSLGTNVYESERLISGGMTGSEVRDFIEAADGFAEVYPEHKYQVVSMLQERGHLTAMTGDGVNDAPSLKKADCGIAVQGASDAARTAADVVFLGEGLSTIITSIKVARQIFHRMKAYIVYRIALCIHLELYLCLSILILNETIRVDLVVFLAIFADVATIAIAYDNAPYDRKPVDWQLPKVWIMSTLMGMMLAGGTWIIRGTLLLSDGGIIQNFGSVQEILFLEVALTESWVILITRMAIGPSSGPFVLPSWQLLAAVLGVDALATIFALFGWISGPGEHGGWTDIVTVVKIWGYSFGVFVVVGLLYYILSTFQWLDNVGRRNRSKKNVKLENFISEMQRLTLVHERDSSGESYYRIATGPSAEEKAKSEKQKAAAAKNAAEAAKKTVKVSQHDTEEKGSRIEPSGSKQGGNGGDTRGTNTPGTRSPGGAASPGARSPSALSMSSGQSPGGTSTPNHPQ